MQNNHTKMLCKNSYKVLKWTRFGRDVRAWGLASSYNTQMSSLSRLYRYSMGRPGNSVFTRIQLFLTLYHAKQHIYTWVVRRLYRCFIYFVRLKSTWGRWGWKAESLKLGWLISDFSEMTDFYPRIQSVSV